jgi:hypothetical protein
MPGIGVSREMNGCRAARPRTGTTTVQHLACRKPEPSGESSACCESDSREENEKQIGLAAANSGHGAAPGRSRFTTLLGAFDQVGMSEGRWAFSRYVA